MSGAFKKDWVYWMAGWLAMCLLLLAFSLSLPYLSSPFLFHLAPFPSLSHISPSSSISVQLAGHNRRIQDFSHFLMDPGGVERPTNSLSLFLSLSSRIQLVRSIIRERRVGKLDLDLPSLLSSRGFR